MIEPQPNHWSFRFRCEANRNQDMFGKFETEDEAREAFDRTAKENPDLEGVLWPPTNQQ